MFIDILFFTFVSAFVVIAALGHVLLIAAIWPGLLGKQGEPQGETVAIGAAHRIHQPN